MLSAEEKKARKAARMKKHYEANKEKLLAQAKKWQANNRERIRAKKKEWNVANKKHIAQKNKQYRQENAGLKNAHTARRRALKLQATPPWADIVYIKSIYEKAAEAGMHVDHIIPLQGELVCGLHVERNLQLLTPTENSSKGNRFDGEKYVHILP